MEGSMAIIKEGVLPRAVIALWAALSLPYLYLLQHASTHAEGINAAAIFCLLTAALFFASDAALRLSKVKQAPHNINDWWGLAYAMLKLPVFCVVIGLVGLGGIYAKGTIGTYIIVAAVLGGLFGFLYMLSKTYESIYKFTDSNAV
jgi:hypothetical protein